MVRKRIVQGAVLGVLLLAAVAFHRYGSAYWQPLYAKVMGGWTVEEVVARYGPAARERMRPRFEAAGVAYPPAECALLGLKEERILELWARDHGDWRRIHHYPLTAASGGPGPKLREGDRQVPEGDYRIVALNPDSGYHLSLKLDYPNADDRRRAVADGRDDPGSDIFIHGEAVSIGCLAVGDPAIEELFVLTEKVGAARVRVLVAPHDPRERSLFPVAEDLPAWTAELYAELEEAFAEFAGGEPARGPETAGIAER